MAKYVWDYPDNLTRSYGPQGDNLPVQKNRKKQMEDDSENNVALAIEDDTEAYEDNTSLLDSYEVEEDQLLRYEKDDGDDSIKYYLEEISRYKLLTADEEKDLSKRIQSGDQRALDHLIQANLRLVVKIAKQYTSNEYPLIDIIQDGNLGLIRACEKFDHRKNVRFSTYASWWIKQTIVRSLSIRKRMIRIPHRKEEKYRKIKKTIEQYIQKNRLEPSYEELSELTDISQEEIRELMSSMVNVVSYENTFVEDDSCTILNMLSDNKEKPDDRMFDQQLRQETEKLLNTLQPKEREVIIRRFGFDSGEKSTLKEMGDALGISAETIRQIEIKALRKLRVNFKHLRDYLN